MIEMSEPTGCGNAPRHHVIRNLVLALAEASEARLRDLLAENVEWDVVGEGAVEGLAGVGRRLSGEGHVGRIEIGSILTHGREGGVDGVLTFSDGSRLAFCHVLKFGSTAKTAKVVVMRSCLVKLQS